MLEEFGIGLCWIKSLGPGLGVGYEIQSNWRYYLQLMRGTEVELLKTLGYSAKIVGRS